MKKKHLAAEDVGKWYLLLQGWIRSPGGDFVGGGGGEGGLGSGNMFQHLIKNFFLFSVFQPDPLSGCVSVLSVSRRFTPARYLV